MNAHPYARIRAHRRGWLAAGLSYQQAGVLEALLLRQPRDEEPARVTIEVLADDLARSRGTVQQTLRALEDAGWVISVPVGRAGYRRARRAVVPDSPDAAAAVPVEVPDRHGRPAQAPAQDARDSHAHLHAQVHAQDAREYTRKHARDVRALGTEGHRDNGARQIEPSEPGPDFAAMRANLDASLGGGARSLPGAATEEPRDEKHASILDGLRAQVEAELALADERERQHRKGA